MGGAARTLGRFDILINVASTYVRAPNPTAADWSSALDATARTTSDVDDATRLTRTRGTVLRRSSDAVFAFPAPEQLWSAQPQSLGALGFSRQKSGTLIRLAQECAGDESHLEALATLDDRHALAALLKFHGIGRWSAEYTMLRGFGRLNVFPADDVSGQKNLHRWLGLRKSPTYERARRLLSRWHPYQGLLYFHFLLAKLEERGFLAERVQATSSSLTARRSRKNSYVSKYIAGSNVRFFVLLRWVDRKGVWRFRLLTIPAGVKAPQLVSKTSDSFPQTVYLASGRNLASRTLGRRLGSKISAPIQGLCFSEL